MKSIAFLALALLLGAAAPPPQAAAAPPAGTQRVVLAGGCFWGMQLVFESLKGVKSAVAGYSGGAAATAHYEFVSTGMTGHAESVLVTYDPAVIPFSKLLQIYFTVAHDPTELNRQGPDDGSQYRSEIYYTTPGQREEAVSEIARLTREHKFCNRSSRRSKRLKASIRPKITIRTMRCTTLTIRTSRRTICRSYRICTSNIRNW